MENHFYHMVRCDSTSDTTKVQQARPPSSIRLSHFGVFTLIVALMAATPHLGQAQLNFGDDDSTWAMDGECDDPRFEGVGMAAVAFEEDVAHDATDCRALLDEGRIQLRAPDEGETESNEIEIDFGNDSGTFARDGECDDPRFEGNGMALLLLDEDRARDATDCRALFEQSEIHLRSDAFGIDFGDDTSIWSNDGECDDPRFYGTGMAVLLGEANRVRDATDCRALFEQREIRLPVATVDIDFGNDTGDWPLDDECDDFRFQGFAMAPVLLKRNLRRDATDCRGLAERGVISLRPGMVYGHATRLSS
jgi:hypothetical protein